MAFLKKNLMLILFCTVCVGSLGGAGWAYIAGDDIIEQVQALERLNGNVLRAGAGAANTETIAARKRLFEARNKRMDSLLEDCLAPQNQNAYFGSKPRAVLIEDALPEPKSDADRINFRDEYKREFNKILEYLQARDKPTRQEIAMQSTLINQQGPSQSDLPPWWRPKQRDTGPDSRKPEKARSLIDVIAEYPSAKAAELVAREIYMYVDKNAIKPHDIYSSDGKPNATQIWQAQMGLWIQQDLVAALGRLNDARAKELAAAGREYDQWVAFMPVKRLERLAFRGWLGKGGGSNEPRTRFAPSFTKLKNEKKMFIVPVNLQLIIEEASLMDLLESLCKCGYYTPINVQTALVEPSILQEDYIYGEGPLLELTVNLEAYFFRDVFDQWIPKNLKKVLEKPKAIDNPSGRR